MCDPLTIAAVTATVAQGAMAFQQGRAADKLSQFNARNQENEAIRVRNKGVQEEMRHREKVQQLASRQRTQMAASGTDIGTGTNLALQEETELFGEVDALRIRENFLDEARVREDQAGLTRARGKVAQSQGRLALGASLLSAAAAGFGSGVADKWFTKDSSALVGTTMTGDQANLLVGNIA